MRPCGLWDHAEREPLKSADGPGGHERGHGTMEPWGGKGGGEGGEGEHAHRVSGREAVGGTTEPWSHEPLGARGMEP